MRPWIRSLSNIFPKRPRRDAFLAQNTMLSAKKAPAERLSDLRNIKPERATNPKRAFIGGEFHSVFMEYRVALRDTTKLYELP